jgi:hypothetical protein
MIIHVTKILFIYLSHLYMMCKIQPKNLLHLPLHKVVVGSKLIGDNMIGIRQRNWILDFWNGCHVKNIFKKEKKKCIGVGECTWVTPSIKNWN